MVSGMNARHKNNQRGSVSIFMVIFSALFVTIITVSFIGLMLRGAQQAVNADLSNSAYDAALAGVEDAKRMLLKYRQCLRDNNAFADCTTIKSMFDNPQCNMVKRSITGAGPNDNTEMLIQSSNVGDTNSRALDQAYTCVIINYLADEKTLEVKDGESVLVPIDSNGVGYSTVNISWFTRDPETNLNLSLPTGGSNRLPTKSEWMNVGAGNTRPPILRAQWIQHSATFNAADFDSDKFENFQTVANTKSIFLYPNTVGVPSGTSLNAVDDRPSSNPAIKAPVPVTCQPAVYNFSGGYACSIDLALPEPIGNTGERTGYIQLGALYNSTKVRVALKNGTDPVKIVAPGIDSTGRANDLFRRVKVGISFSGEYPRAGFDINGNICKDFSVTDTAAEFDSGSCDPNNP